MEPATTLWMLLSTPMPFTVVEDRCVLSLSSSFEQKPTVPRSSHTAHPYLPTCHLRLGPPRRPRTPGARLHGSSRSFFCPFLRR